MIDWIKDTLIKEKAIAESDLDIMTVVDTPEEAVRTIKRRVIV